MYTVRFTLAVAALCVVLAGCANGVKALDSLFQPTDVPGATAAATPAPVPPPPPFPADLKAAIGSTPAK